MFNELHISKNQEVSLSILKEKRVRLFVKREDLIHKEVSGNKFRKLKYNLIEAQKKGLTTLLTFGGAYSNHILATSVAGKLMNFETIGVIRGDELGEDLEKTLAQNTTLRSANKYGMKLVFISRQEYRDKMNDDFLESLRQQFGDFYVIPEGGTNALAVKGCEEILTNEDAQFDYICSCVGTGGTIAGLINSAVTHQKVIGFPALKGDFLNREIQELVGERDHWELTTQYHFGGYAKYADELNQFINEFRQQTSIPLDPIYTGKMLFGILDMIQNDRFSEGTKILAVHTGGLQGIEGFNQRLQNKGSNLRIEI